MLLLYKSNKIKFVSIGVYSDPKDKERVVSY